MKTSVFVRRGEGRADHFLRARFPQHSRRFAERGAGGKDVVDEQDAFVLDLVPIDSNVCANDVFLPLFAGGKRRLRDVVLRLLQQRFGRDASVVAGLARQEIRLVVAALLFALFRHGDIGNQIELSAEVLGNGLR